MKKSGESKDLAEKNFEGYPDVAADIINALLYGGERVVSAENLVPAPTESVYSGKECLRSQYQDVAKYEMLGGEINAAYQFANQSDTDSKMVLRKSGYTGGVYREQYEGKVSGCFPVMELVLYWGEKPWRSARNLRRLLRRRELSPKAWEYIDDVRLHVWEMRHLSAEVRRRFQSDMRIVADYLAEGNLYRSDRKVVHKEALIRMILALSGERDTGDVAEFLKESGIREEDEVTVCELFDQYVRQGRREGRLEGRREGRQEGRREGRDMTLLENIRALMRNMSWTAEQAMKALSIPTGEQADYLARL